MKAYRFKFSPGDIIFVPRAPGRRNGELYKITGTKYRDSDMSGEYGARYNCRYCYPAFGAEERRKVLAALKRGKIHISWGKAGTMGAAYAEKNGTKVSPKRAALIIAYMDPQFRVPND